MVCDFRVQCGRCSDSGEREACTAIWSGVAGVYGLAGLVIAAQILWSNVSKRKDSVLLLRVLFLWGLAYMFRALGGSVLASHADTKLHPVVLELLWHAVWLCGCVSLTYFFLVTLNAGFQSIGMQLRDAIPVSRYVTLINLAWLAVFCILSAVDGTRRDWPRAGVQWLVWMCCAVYLFVGVSYSVRLLTASLDRHAGTAAPRAAQSDPAATSGGAVALEERRPLRRSPCDSKSAKSRSVSASTPRRSKGPTTPRPAQRATGGVVHAATASTPKHASNLKPPTSSSQSPHGLPAAASQTTETEATSASLHSGSGQRVAPVVAIPTGGGGRRSSAGSDRAVVIRRSDVNDAKTRRKSRAVSRATPRGVTRTLRLFTMGIIVGLAAYSLFLLSLAVLSLAFNGSRTLTSEVLITVAHQTGMLCMGIGMQIGVLL